MGFRGSGLWLVAALACTPLLHAQSARPKDLAAGKFLVANRKLLDPNFAETVVLLVKYQEDAVVGLVLNRRTSIPISRALTVSEAKRRADPIYHGGPVEESVVMALARMGVNPNGATHVFGDLYLISTRQLLTKTMGSPLQDNSFRVYLGYAGWTGPQLRHEVDIGGWFIFPGDAKMVFDSDPGSLWSRFIDRAEMQVAINRR